MDSLTSAQIQDLIKLRHSSCVSIFHPTVPAGADGQQNPIRLKKLLKQAEDQLVGSGIRAPDARTLLQPARNLLNDELFWRRQSNGLAVFLTAERFRYYRVPLDLEERLIVSDRFHVKPLLPLLSANRRFHVLALSRKRVRLFEGTQYGLREMEVEGLPAGMDEALNYDEVYQGNQVHSASNVGRGKQSAVFHSQGGQPETLKEDLQKYFRIVDGAVVKRLAGLDAPLLLAAVEYEVPIYREVSRHGRLLEGAVLGNADHLSPHQLHAKAWPLVESYLDAQRQAAVEAYRHQVGAGKASDAVEQIVVAAHRGRVDTLLLVERATQWGTFDRASGMVQLHNRQQPGDEDLLELASVATLLQRGSVFTVARNDDLGGASAAAIFRY